LIIFWVFLLPIH